MTYHAPQMSDREFARFFGYEPLPADRVRDESPKTEAKIETAWERGKPAAVDLELFG